MPAVILDSNLLVLFIIGRTSPELIERHRRLQAYSVSDFDLLIEFIAPMSQLIVTPNTLTETSNLLKHIAEPARAQIAATFRDFVRTADERYVESARAVDQSEFPRLWLTDAVVLTELHSHKVLLTADLNLYLAALRRGETAVNFNHLREASLR
jgi:hypothetical protein